MEPKETKIIQEKDNKEFYSDLISAIRKHGITEKNGVSNHPVLLDRWNTIDDINPNFND